MLYNDMIKIGIVESFCFSERTAVLYMEPICTYTGIIMYPLAPKESDFYIEDIAHALSLMTRANGHFEHFYSVGQHCLACSYEGELRGYSTRVCLALLLHDASEAYLSDITRPVKISLPNYVEIEKNLQKVLFSAFGLGSLSEEEKAQISAVDDAMLYYEFEHLHRDGGFGKEYHLLGNHSLAFQDMSEVELLYQKQYDKLTKLLGENYDRSN